MNKKIWYKSKEVWVVGLGILNAVLNHFGLPSFNPTPEFYSSLLVVIGVLRTFFTESRLILLKNE